jgi:hypothetical protein
MITFICVRIASPGWLAVRNISWILLALTLAQAPGYAQTTDSSSGQIEVGVTCGPIGPLGDFRRNVGSWSFNNKGVLNFDLILHLHRSGLLRLRFDYFFGQYHGDTVSDYKYYLRGFSLGPEVGLSDGPVRPYVNAGYGWLSFLAGSWLTKEERQQIRKSIHGAGGWFCGGGGRIPVGPTGRWAIDIGLRCHRGGTASYLADGGIRKNPDGSLTVISTRGQMPFVMFTLGFQFRPWIDK